MATQTSRLGLIKPDEDDYYDIREHNRNMDTLDAAVVVGSGVLQVRAVSPEEYEELTPNAFTLYCIVSGSYFALMLGDKPLQSSGGSSPQSSVIRVTQTEPVLGSVVTMEVPE